MAAIVGLLIWILDGKTALYGAKEGVKLCLEAVIPALFPFFVLNGLLMDRLMGRSRHFGRGLLIPAFLGGYPMGADCIGRACRMGTLDRRRGEELLAFCSNAGPAFLFGVVGPLFPEGWMVWSLWGIHVLSALMTAAVLPAGQGGSLPASRSASGVMKDAVKAMALVCGWIVLARGVLAFLDRWVLWLLPLPGQVLVSGMVELTNGCLRLGQLESLSQRYVFCSLFLAMGGLCVTLQTASVAEGLSLRRYFLGKTLQTVFSLGLAVGVVTGTWPGILGISGLILLISRKLRKCSRKIPAVGV